MTAAPRIAALVGSLLIAGGAGADDLFDDLSRPEAPLATEPSPADPLPAEPVPTPAPASSGDGLRRPIGELTLTAPVQADLAESLDRLPEGFAIADPAARRFDATGVTVVNADLAPSRFKPSPVHWAAPATHSSPLWFEQPNVERYGHHRRLYGCDVLTPSAISAAHFFADAAVLPWKAVASPACDCDYTLGAYRPGSCNPHQWLRCERPLVGASGEALAIAGLILLIP